MAIGAVPIVHFAIRRQFPIAAGKALQPNFFAQRIDVLTHTLMLAKHCAGKASVWYELYSARARRRRALSLRGEARWSFFRASFREPRRGNLQPDDFLVSSWPKVASSRNGRSSFPRVRSLPLLAMTKVRLSSISRLHGPWSLLTPNAGQGVLKQ